MKTLKNILAAMLFPIAQGLAAQVPPTPPAPPATHSSRIESTHSDQVVDNGRSSSTSISETSADERYKLRARFDKDRDAEVLRLLHKELGAVSEEGSGPGQKWEVRSGDDVVYSVEFKSGNLDMLVNKKIASLQLTELIEGTGRKCRALFTDLRSEEADKYEQEQDKIMQEEDRINSEADRLEREAERLDMSSEQDAKRLKAEAARLRAEADRLEREAERVKEQ